MTDRKSRLAERLAEPSEQLIADPSASFTYELATKAPTKDVASVKAASDVHDANAETSAHVDVDRRLREPAHITDRR